jgi:hypothetical protein
MGITEQDAICDAIDEADAADKIMLPEGAGKQLAAMRDVENTVLRFCEHLKYPLARPDQQGQHAVVMMNYIPDLPDILSYHFARMGWRWHPELAMIKQRRIIGGLFDDLVAYVPLDEPDDPIVVESNMQAAIDPNLWPVTPKVNIVDEERPPE